MHHKIIAPIVVATLLFGALLYAANGSTYTSSVDNQALFATPQSNKGGDRRMVDMVADDSYLIDNGDSTIFILVGNFAAHHNGTVILADSAVRYSNQSFECFGNVLINQNDTYAYGDRAEYNRDNSTATIYSELIKVVDGDAVMYAYNCTFNTADNLGYLYGGCYVEKGENLMESDRGYYNTETHELIAVKNVEMRNETYLMTGDSIIFNTATEDARYFTNSNIWNDKEEYLFANEGSYTKKQDLHHLTRDAYILSPEREIWSDTIEYYRTEGHIIGRRNIQMEDTTQKVLSFADYGEWWDEPGNAFFTHRPSMINYDPQQPDSVFISADTLWLYTIAVLPPVREEDRAVDAQRSDSTEHRELADSSLMANDIETSSMDEATTEDSKSESPSSEVKPAEEDAPKRGDKESKTDKDNKDATGGKGNKMNIADKAREGFEEGKRESNEAKLRSTKDGRDASTIPHSEEITNEGDSAIASDSTLLDSLAVDSLATDSIKVYTAKQLRYRAKLEKRRIRDSIRAEKRAIRDSIDSIKQAEKDSIRHIRDSILDIKIDSIIAKRRARSAELADQEKARLLEIKRKADDRYRRKIEKAQARALKRGKEYKGPEYVRDSALWADPEPTQDSLNVDSGIRDSITTDSLVADSLVRDSISRDSVTETPFPEDSVYKMIKAYRRVKMYRSDSQLVCDSMVLLNTDSIIRLYIDPVMWNEDNQITADSMAIYTHNELLSKAHFMGDPIMGMEIDTTYYNQVKGKDMTSYFADGVVYRNDVVGNAQTIYYMQNEDSPEVTGLMYIESASITFYLEDSAIDKITYKQNPVYALYPMDKIPETQELRLKDFEWHADVRPSRDSVCSRQIRPTQRDKSSSRQKPRFRITERIDYDRRRLVENGVWEDRVDELSPEVIEWRNTRTSYKQHK